MILDSKIPSKHVNLNFFLNAYHFTRVEARNEENQIKIIINIELLIMEQG